MARNYHEPDPFRYALGAFIQAARSTTFMLAKERSAFDNFDWYSEWVEKAKKDPVLAWINNARTAIVHRQSLEPQSWLEMQCIGNPRQPEDPDDEDYRGPLRGQVSPFECTHYYMNTGGPWVEDHTHEFTRHWGIEGLEGRELLEACADVYDRLDELVRDAHRRLKASMLSHGRDNSPRSLPCMEDIIKHRVIRTTLRDGREYWDSEPPGLHSH
jgi:hypothetical protein